MKPSRPVESDQDSQQLSKCAHPGCRCRVPADGTFGRYCGSHCQEAGEMNELRRECGHDSCR